jgi:hypothetical protein
MNPRALGLGHRSALHPTRAWQSVTRRWRERFQIPEPFFIRVRVGSNGGSYPRRTRALGGEPLASLLVARSSRRELRAAVVHRTRERPQRRRVGGEFQKPEPRLRPGHVLF